MNQVRVPSSRKAVKKNTDLRFTLVSALDITSDIVYPHLEPWDRDWGVYEGSVPSLIGKKTYLFHKAGSSYWLPDGNPIIIMEMGSRRDGDAILPIWKVHQRWQLLGPAIIDLAKLVRVDSTVFSSSGKNLAFSASQFLGKPGMGNPLHPN